MDPLESLDLAWDTSLCLLRELQRRGHETYLFTPSDLSSISNRVKGRGYLIRSLGSRRYHQGLKKNFDLASFDAVFIRKDPPFDSGYLALTYLLEPLAKQTRVINHPRGIRNANEKLFGLAFKRWSPPTLVTADPSEILAFQKKIRSGLVIKPLYEKGGKGVFRLSPHPNPLPSRGEGRVRGTTVGELRRLRKFIQNGIPVVAQKFISVAPGSGDKRILIWRGKILGGFLRIPRAGEFRSNLSLGGRFVPCTITESERRLVSDLGPVLAKEGLSFVGIDVRGGKLIEVNVTSPAGLVELDQLYGSQATAKVVDDLESL